MVNMGYACINTHLSNCKPKVTTNRTMIKRTFTERGLPYASELALQNCQDLITIIQWNHDNGFKFFRMSSDIIPWASEYELSELPDYDDGASETSGAAGEGVDDHFGPDRSAGCKWRSGLQGT